MEKDTLLKAVEINTEIEKLKNLQKDLSGKKYGITFLRESYNESFRCQIPKSMDDLIFTFIEELVKLNLIELEEIFKNL